MPSLPDRGGPGPYLAVTAGLSFRWALARATRDDRRESHVSGDLESDVTSPRGS